MLWLVCLAAGGLLSGVLLLRRLPSIPLSDGASELPLPVSIIIPARNEEQNLPSLLESIQQSMPPLREVLVVDDASTDGTAAVAKSFGARVLSLNGPPNGWTGKTWACQSGANAARSDTLFFLDADTRLLPDGLGRIATHFATLGSEAALSVLPFHRTRCWYEQLSLFFNLLMAIGAGGFSGLDQPRLFGPSLMIGNDLYRRCGGHRAVRGKILENLHLAAHLRNAGARPYTFVGRGVLEVRMFPEGLAQLCEGWRKAFADGAGATSPLILGLSIYWLGGAMLTFLTLCAPRNHVHAASAILYLLFAFQIGERARRLGTFRWIGALLYPVPLVFYFVLFAQSMGLRHFARPVLWRGREL